MIETVLSVLFIALIWAALVRGSGSGSARDRLRDAKNRIDTLEGWLASSRRDYARECEVVRDREDRIERLAAEVVRLNDEVAGLNAEVSRLQECALIGESDADKQCATLRAELEAANVRVAELEVCVENARGCRDTMLRESERHHEIIRRLADTLRRGGYLCE